MTRLLFLTALLAAPAALRAQAPSVITLTREGGTPAPVAAATLRALPRAAATLTAHGTAQRYSGVPLAALLAQAGAWPVGDARGHTTGARGGGRGAALTRYVVVTGADGYRALLALAELDTATVAPAAGGPVLLADSVDGRPLPAGEGPYRLVVPGDRRPARSVRQVRAIAVQSAP